MKINQIYLNGLKKCYADFNSCNEEIKVFENKVNYTLNELTEWTNKNIPELKKISDKENVSDNDINKYEKKLIEYETIIEKLKNNIKPHVDKLQNLKKEINIIYSKIMLEYGSKYTEKEIIEAIQKEVL